MPLRSICRVLLLAAGPLAAAETPSPLSVIHEGAGIKRKHTSPEDEVAIRAALTQRLTKRYAQLAEGKSALDAVTAAITTPPGRPTQIGRRQSIPEP